ncbi:MAG: hypothetical protein WC477_01935 [Patescibacteria group bacterium]
MHQIPVIVTASDRSIPHVHTKENDVPILLIREFYTTIGVLAIYMGSTVCGATRGHALFISLTCVYIEAFVAFVMLLLTMLVASGAGTPACEYSRTCYAPRWAYNAEAKEGALSAAACLATMPFAVALCIDRWKSMEGILYFVGCLYAFISAFVGFVIGLSAFHDNSRARWFPIGLSFIFEAGLIIYVLWP